MEKLYVLDASGYIYRNYFAIGNMTNGKGESTNALYGFIRSVAKLFKECKPTHAVAVFDGPNNAKKRKELYEPYKAHRLAMPSDMRQQIERAHEFCKLMGIPYLNLPEAEADDVMGSIAKWASRRGSNVYLCTSDKDLCQLVDEKVFILNASKDHQLVDAAEVERVHGVPPVKMIDYLAIVGDSSDNVPGLPGFGPKTAADLLGSLGSLDYILTHPEKVPGKKKQETIEGYKSQALLSRELVTIDTGVPFPETEEFFRLQPIEKDELKRFYAEMNFNSLIKELGELTKGSAADEKTDYRLVDDESSFNRLLAYLSTQTDICFDTETTSIHPILAELVGIGFGVESKTTWYVPVNGALGLQKVLAGVKPLFENPSIGFYGHNVKYDYHILANYGILVQNISFDTILASYLLNSHNRQHSLDFLTLENFDKVKIPTSDLLGKGKNQCTMREVPIEKVSVYCCEDVDYTCRLKELLEKQLAQRQLDRLYFTVELPLMPILASMERRGIYLDVPLLKEMSSSIIIEIDALAQRIHRMAGVEFNINSPLQLKKILFEHLAIPYPKKRAVSQSTGEEILELLTDYPIAAAILEYRKLEKLRSTYLDALPLSVNPKTRRIHCTFNQSVAATGRLSCQDPNLQNIPVRTTAGKKIREAFRPEHAGWSYVSADYSQIELRLLAHLSEDPYLLSAFQMGEDIHASTAAAIYHIPIEEVTKEQRHNAKAVNFGIIYGQQAFGLSQGLSITSAEAAAFIETYFKKFTKVKEFIDSCKASAHATGKAVTYTGRERLIPEIHSSNGMLRAQAERLAVNTPIQGFAADLIKMAMIRVENVVRREGLKGFMILQIHDELIFEVPDEELPAFKLLVQDAMENVFKLKIPLSVDIAIGKNWKEC